MEGSEDQAVTGCMLVLPHPGEQAECISQIGVGDRKLRNNLIKCCWKGLQKVSGPNPCKEHIYSRLVKLHPAKFQISPEMETVQPLCVPV